MSRTEHDALGPLSVPEQVLYGIYTQRVINNFPYQTANIPVAFMRHYVQAKKAYAKANHKNKKLKKPHRDAIVKACDTILQRDETQRKQNCPISRIQSGGGTSTNMYINEIISNVAHQQFQQSISSHDHVNMSQSSNDTFPGTCKLTTLEQLQNNIKSTTTLINTCENLAKKFSSIAKVGRTHLQDAVIISLGDEFGAYAKTLQKNNKYCKQAYEVACEMNFGGTATGSKQNITSAIRKSVIDELKRTYKHPIKQTRNYFEQNSSAGDFLYISQTINHFAIDLIKICNDLRLLSSGPFAGLGEITLPAVQPGSSIIPGKINPSILEAATMACASIQGHHKTVEVLTSMAQLQLQQFHPSIARAIYDSIDLLNTTLAMLNDKCIKHIKPNTIHIQKILQDSFAYATDYSEKLGYDVVAQAVTQAIKQNKSLKDILGELQQEN